MDLLDRARRWKATGVGGQRSLGAVHRWARAGICPLVALLMLLAADAAWAKPLRVGIAELPASYGNPYTAVGIPSALVWLQIFDALTKISSEGKLVGALAEDWHMETPTRWRFHLRKDASFSNGKPFTAESAQAVFHWLQSETGRATIVANALTTIESVEVIDEFQLVINTVRPDPILPNRLTTVMMVEPQSWATLGPKEFAVAPVGTGSYSIESWQSIDGAAVLRVNPYSWRRPIIEHVEIFPLRDHAARFQATISQQLDLTISMRPELIGALAQRNFEIIVDPTKQIIGLAFDVVGHPNHPIADRRVRQAMNLAIDTETISKVITEGVHPPASQGAAPGVFGYNPDIAPYPYAPERARELLVSAGVPDGFDVSASVVIGTYANDVEIYQKVQQDLSAVGIQLTIESTVFADWLQQYAFNNWSTEMFSLAWNNTPFNDALRPMEYFSCKKAKPFFCNPEMMPLIERATVETDLETREDILQQLELQFHNEAPHLFLLEYGHIWAVSRNLQGFKLDDRIPQLHQLSFGPGP